MDSRSERISAPFGTARVDLLAIGCARHHLLLEWRMGAAEVPGRRSLGSGPAGSRISAVSAQHAFKSIMSRRSIVRFKVCSRYRGVMTCFFDFSRHHNSHRWFLPVTREITAGPPDKLFLFGGSGLEPRLRRWNALSIARRYGRRPNTLVCTCWAHRGFRREVSKEPFAGFHLNTSHAHPRAHAVM